MSNQRAYDSYWRRCIDSFNEEHPPGAEDAERDYEEGARDAPDADGEEAP